MSFAALTKKELTLITEQPCCRKAELAAIVIQNGRMFSEEDRDILTVETENVATARRIYTMLKELFQLKPEVLVRKKMRLKKNNVYGVRVTTGLNSVVDGLRLFQATSHMIDTNLELTKSCCRRAFLRGAFLASGSINDPGSNSYHLEVSFNSSDQAYHVRDLMNRKELNAKVIGRKNGHIVYLKEGEKIVEFLSLIGAHQALLKFEDVRILKGMRNQVNRLVNCETANLNKTILAAVRQQEAIQVIDAVMGLGNLPDHLREVAELRLKYPEANLQELAENLINKVSKSGLNHRFRKLVEIANQLRGRAGSG